MPLRKKTPARQAGMVHVSTLLIAVLAALLAGIFAGSTFFSSGAGAPGSTVPPQAVQEQAPAAGGLSQEARDHIAQHERTVAANPNDFDEWVALGNLYYDSRDARNAVRAYARALAIRPSEPDVLTDKGTMHRMLQEYEQALACYDRAIAVRPDHAHAWFNRGVVLRDMGREEDAWSSWKEVVRLNPQAAMPGTGQLVRDVLRQAGKL